MDLADHNTAREENYLKRGRKYTIKFAFNLKKRERRARNKLKSRSQGRNVYKNSLLYPKA